MLVTTNNLPAAAMLESLDLLKKDMQVIDRIVKLLVYFDLFEHPLTLNEIAYFIGANRGSDPALTEALDYLLSVKTIRKHQEFYGLHDLVIRVAKRKEQNEHAIKAIRTGKKIGKILYQFPFVRGIGISGSLSKKVAHAGSDIDFFIVTKRDRLWIARTAMHMLKKLSFLFGKQHWLCMNYYVDELALEIEEHNIFTSTELFTLLPVCGKEGLDALFAANSWARAYYPNYCRKTATDLAETKHSLAKRLLEKLFAGSIGEWLDNYLERLTAKRWNKKEQSGHLNARGLPLGIRTSKHLCKPKAEYFQNRIVGLFTNEVTEIYRQYFSAES